MKPVKRDFFSIWVNAKIWAFDTADRLWCRGTVEEVIDSNESSWTFAIRLEDNRLRNVTTLFSDKYGTEFQYVKRRSDDDEHMRCAVDMTSLVYLNEPEMLSCLQHRYHTKSIYTNMGPILIAVNPFQHLDESVYGISKINAYATDKTLLKQPHVYQIGERAYSKMFIDKFDPNKRENECILINGESGAGKTESTKHVLQYLTHISAKVASNYGMHLCNGEMSDIESLITATNPIAESFGNAKTLRNNNSSRFGKFIELVFSSDGYIVGGVIQTYLLETIRVTTQSQGERNYHIFYELLSSMTQDQSLKWHCDNKTLSSFKYTNQSNEFLRYDGESDCDNFTKLRRALTTVQLSHTRQDELFGVIVSVLHVGNLEFKTIPNTGGDESAGFSESCKLHVDAVCDLLHVTKDVLLSAVARRTIVVAGSSIEKGLNVDAAISARDAFAKTIYELVFTWVMQQTNTCLALDDVKAEAASFIGVLDIFGFESFQKNSFEQLCINFANEKLQDHFNFSIFQSEKEVYDYEGIAWVVNEYPDNSERLQLFEHKSHGIFALCDDQLKVPKPTDEKLVRSFYTKCASLTHFAAKPSEQRSLEFIVKHFAYDVKYSIDGFVNKNRNEVALEIFNCFDSSSSAFVNDLLTSSEDRNAKRAVKDHGVTSLATSDNSLKGRKTTTVGRKTVSISSIFTKNLNELIAKIRACRSHFIRCIKPNNLLQPNNFSESLVLQQLQCGGALGAAQVFRSGFPNRMEFKFFVLRYSSFVVSCGSNSLTKDTRNCIKHAVRSESETMWKLSASMLIGIVSLTATILNAMESIEDDVLDILKGLQLGRTQVFLRASVFEYLESLLYRAMALIARRLQLYRRLQLLRRDIHIKSSAALVTAQSVVFYSHRTRTLTTSRLAAMILLQRRSKVFLAMSWRKRILQGIISIQSIYRGVQARQLVYNLKRQAVTLIQTQYRCYQRKKMFVHLKNSTIQLQKHLRAWIARYMWRKKKCMASLLQRCWRGVEARIKVFHFREKKKKEFEELRIQRAKANASFLSNLEAKLNSSPDMLSDMMNVFEQVALLKSEKAKLSKLNKELEDKNEQLNNQVTDLTNKLSLVHSSINTDDVSQRNIITYVGDDSSLTTEHQKLSLLDIDNDCNMHANDVIDGEENGVEQYESLPTITQKCDIDIHLNKSNFLEYKYHFLSEVQQVIEFLRQLLAEKVSDKEGLENEQKKVHVNISIMAQRREEIARKQSWSEEEALRFKAALVRLQECFVKCEKEIGPLKEALNKLIAKVEQLDKDIEILEGERMIVCSAQQGGNERDADVAVTKQALKQHLSDLNRQHDVATAQMNDLTAQIAEKTDRKVQLMVDLDSSMNGLLSLQIEVAKCNDEEMDIIDGREKLVSAIDILEKSIEAACLVVDDLRNELFRMEQVYDILKTDLLVKEDDEYKVVNKPTKHEMELQSKINSLVDELIRQKEKYAELHSQMDSMESGLGVYKRSNSMSPSGSFERLSDLGNRPLTYNVDVVNRSVDWIQPVDAFVESWCRVKGTSRIVYVIDVRPLNTTQNISWKVTKSFAEFKEMKSLLALDDHVDILDNLFPLDIFTFWGLSDNDAENRKESLNLFLVALCGCESIMTKATNSNVLLEFLEYHNEVNKSNGTGVNNADSDSI